MIRTFTRFYGLLHGRMRLRFGALLLIALGSSLVDGVSLSLIFPFVTAIQDPTFHERNIYVAAIAQRLSLGSHHEVILFLGSLLLVVFLAKNLFLTASTWLKHRFILANHVEFQTHLYRGYLRSSYADHLTRDAATVLRNCTSSVDLTFVTFLTASVNLATEVLVILIITVLLVLISDVSALVVLAAILLVAVGIASVLRHRVQTWGKVFQDIQTDVFQIIQQSLRGIKVVKIYGVENELARSFANVARTGARFRLKYQIAGELPRQLLEVVMLAGLLGALGVALLRGQPLAEAVAVLATVAVAGFRLVPSINRVITFMVSLKFATAAVDALYEDAQAFRESEKDERSLEQERPILDAVDRITFDDVTYQYRGEARRSLDGIRLEIRRGEFIGVVGRSGAGKTTLVDVLLGLLKPTSGRLLINGLDAAAGRRRLRGLIGYIPQSVHLLNDTIRQNIVFGTPEHEIDEDKVRAAAESAALGDFLTRLPKGLETRVGDDGLRLSGGERQRVTIARALYRRSQILVLDEATTALDSETESVVTDVLESMRGKVTLITIAHRLATVRKCDRIVFLDQGRIVDVDTFDRLMARNADFAALAQHSMLEPLGEQEPDRAVAPS